MVQGQFACTHEHDAGSSGGYSGANYCVNRFVSDGESEWWISNTHLIRYERELVSKLGSMRLHLHIRRDGF